jgi:hydrogenase nickel incorporation protein HypA/HybF
MHELGVTESILNIILAKAAEAQASKIVKITITLGDLSGFVPECIEFYFESLSKKTIAEGAKLDFEIVTAQFRCRDCSTISSSEDLIWICPNCQSHSLEVVGGQEFYVKDMEVE